MRNFNKLFSGLLIDTKEDENLELYSYRNLKSTKNIMAYNCPSTTSELLNMCRACKDIGSAFTLEKNIIMYGKEEGTTRFNSRVYGVTLENLIKKYGEEEGTNRFNSYCQKQAYSNTFEYKAKCHGMSKEEFDEYNSSRAVTLENLIKKYGEEEGTNRFNSYCQKQAYTNSAAYLGEAEYARVNKAKGHNYENYVRLYGDQAEEKLIAFHSKALPKSGYSKISQDVFNELIKHSIIGDNYYFAECNHEYGVLDKNTKKYFKYDFVSLDHNLCIEFNGDHYHGNPKMYRPDDILKGRGMKRITALDKWIEDEYKASVIKEQRGIHTIYVWESDWLNNKTNVIDRIIDYVSNRV